MAGAMRGQLLRLRPWQSAPAAASHTWRPRQQLQQACWQHTAAPAAAAPPSAARASGAQKTVLGFSRFNVVAGCGKSKTKSTISNNPNFCGEDSFFITEDQSEPYDAVNEGFTVFPNDIIVLATDGLWDNIVMEQIEELSKKAANIELFAKQLVVAGSTRPRKPDDVTVIAARV
ncbi:hypothetical protein DIPPA_01915 [Diplonema papillatum]|nr:hypothetical protein DIPPA_01915 [Diplonema papillatum]